MSFDKIIELLVKSGISERDIESRTNIRQATINRIRNGKIKKPSFDTGFKILQVYKEFLRGEQ